MLLIHSDAAPGGRLYKKGQRGANIRWSNDQYLISIGRPPNPPGGIGFRKGSTSTSSTKGIKVEFNPTSSLSTTKPQQCITSSK